MTLPLASKALAPLLWLLASESKSENGEFDASTEELEFRLHLTSKEIEAGRKPLIDKGFFIIASGVLADGLQGACLETETEGETKKEIPVTAPVGADVFFDEFWKAYPKKVGKDAAIKAFGKRKPSRELVEQMLFAIAEQSKTDKWQKDKGQFIPHPATWLNEGRWKDEVLLAGQSAGAPWYESAAGVDAKAAELNLAPIGPYESRPAFKDRVNAELDRLEKNPPKPISIDQLARMAAQRQAA